MTITLTNEGMARFWKSLKGGTLIVYPHFFTSSSSFFVINFYFWPAESLREVVTLRPPLPCSCPLIETLGAFSFHKSLIMARYFVLLMETASNKPFPRHGSPKGCMGRFSRLARVRPPSPGRLVSARQSRRSQPYTLRLSNVFDAVIEMHEENGPPASSMCIILSQQLNTALVPEVLLQAITSEIRGGKNKMTSKIRGGKNKIPARLRGI